MRLHILLMLAFLGLATSAHAQIPGLTGGSSEGASAESPESSQADIDALIGILEDDAARQRLIDTLRRAAAPQEGGETEADADPTLAGQVAVYTQDVAEGAVEMVTSLGRLASNIAGIFSGAATIDVGALMRVIVNVALVVVLTFTAFFLARTVFHRIQRRLATAAEGAGPIRRTGLITLSTAFDALTVVAAWGVGQVVALNVGETGRPGFNQALFLNAFLFIEILKVGARTIVAPSWASLRLNWFDDSTASYWYFWISRLISIVGYTFLFIAPILQRNVSADAAEAVRVIVMFIALIMACAVILQNRDAMRDLLLRRVSSGRGDAVSRVLAALAGVWHMLAMGYLIVVFLLWLASPETALPFVLNATAWSLVTIAVGLLLISLISRLATRGVRLPADVKDKLPLLERHLNAFVPNLLRVVRIVVAFGVIVTLAQIWQVADFIGWLSSELGQRMAVSLVSSIIILLVGGVAYLAVSSWIEYRLNPNVGTVPTPRERTLLALFRNAFTVVLGVLVFMLVLSELGVNIGPLLAGAGVVGLAIGFGAQKLVQDVITGAFIQFENAMNEGDVVTAGGFTGVVEKLTIRSVSIRTLDGAFHLIPFSSVDAVSNFQKFFSYHVAQIGVDYQEKIPDVKAAMQEAFDRLKQTDFNDVIIGDLEMHGVTEFADSAIVVRARIKTLPGQQWALGRAYNEFIKEVFDERGIDIPFPHVTLYLGTDKEGNTPPLRLETTPSDALPEPDAARASTGKSRRPAQRRRKKPAQDGPPGQGHDVADEEDV